ncbi:MAG: hypothetical protein MZV49_09385 [Rhodopseudomonas palustris]|nr:hypothetical protein [Rhodopseudomonas palustris]
MGDAGSSAAQWHTEQERRCDRWEEEQSRSCSDWGIFSFICIAWTIITTWGLPRLVVHHQNGVRRLDLGADPGVPRRCGSAPWSARYGR